MNELSEELKELDESTYRKYNAEIEILCWSYQTQIDHIDRYSSERMLTTLIGARGEILGAVWVDWDLINYSLDIVVSRSKPGIDADKLVPPKTY